MEHRDRRRAIQCARVSVGKECEIIAEAGINAVEERWGHAMVVVVVWFVVYIAGEESFVNRLLVD